MRESVMHGHVDMMRASIEGMTNVASRLPDIGTPNGFRQ